MLASYKVVGKMMIPIQIMFATPSKYLKSHEHLQFIENNHVDIPASVENISANVTLSY